MEFLNATQKVGDLGLYKVYAAYVRTFLGTALL